MSASPSLRPMFAFPGWVIDNIDIEWEASEAIVHLRRDGRIHQIRSSQCHFTMDKMREKERRVHDLPLGAIT